MGLRVVNTMTEEGISYGEHLLAGLDVTLENGVWSKEDDLIAHTKGADGVLCASPVQEWTPRVIEGLSGCRILATLSIGYERIPLDIATGMGIAVTNIPDYCIDEVSSQAITFIMALGRRLLPICKAVKEKQVFLIPGNRKGLKEVAGPVARLRGQTVGIIGFGKIGTTVALKAQGLGFRVIAYDPYVFDAVKINRGVEPVDLDTLLKESDFITIHAALTDETRGMIDEEQFGKMKGSCYFVNTARGEIVKEDALVDALRRGLIAGAGLDVVAAEPLSASNPLVGMDNVILTGHSAWYSTASDSNPEYWHKAMSQIAMALRGEWPIYAVNPELKQEWLRRWRRP